MYNGSRVLTKSDLFICSYRRNKWIHSFSNNNKKKVLGDLYDNLAHGLVAFHQKMCILDILPVKFFFDKQLVVIGTLCKMFINHMFGQFIT